MGKSLVRFSLLLLVAMMILFLPLTGGEESTAQDGSEPTKAVVRFYLFYSQTCSHCHEVMEKYLPTVYEKYGDQVEYQYFDIHNNTENYATFLSLEMKLGVPQDEQGYVPALIIGDKVLIGSKEIPDKLETYIDEYLAQGGVDFPSLKDLPEVALPTPEPVVQILIFLDPNHRDTETLNAWMASLGQQYGDGLQAYALDVTQSGNAERLAALNAALGVGQPGAGTPEVLIGRQMLVGMGEIERRLPGLVEKNLLQGGLSIPPWEELIGGGSASTATPAPLKEQIYLAYFAQAGCQECARTTYDLQLIQEEYPQVVVETFSIEEAENKALSEWLGQKYGVAEENRLSTPMVFVGEDVLIGDQATAANLLAAVDKYVETGAERTWDDFDPTEAEESLVDRFRSFGVLTVLGAGLVDGLNPCAFATLVFFVSYLAFTGRRGRDILFVGLSFTLGVFLTYLLVGVGLLRAVQSLRFFTALGRWVYLITALLCVILAVLTFRDFFKARAGQMTEMTLRLPMGLRRRIHKVIRESAQVRAFVVMAFVTGFVVSLLELACTGQVYLPTIMFVMSVPELAARAVLYLLLYCVMFILPLLVVFVLSYFGTSSEQLGRFVNRHTATIKFVTGLVFVGLALWMTWTLAPLFDVETPWDWIAMGGVVVVVALGVIVLRLTGGEPPKKRAPRRRRSRA